MSDAVTVPVLLTPREASRWLAEHGYRVSVGRLAIMRAEGTGPHFRKLRQQVRYLPDELGAWIISLMSPPQRSTRDDPPASAAGVPPPL